MKILALTGPTGRVSVHRFHIAGVAGGRAFRVTRDAPRKLRDAAVEHDAVYYTESRDEAMTKAGLYAGYLSETPLHTEGI